MKAGLTLTPIQDQSIALEETEVLWAKSKRVKLLREAPLPRANVTQYVSHENLGPGQLFLTNQRLIWRGERRVEAFWLQQLQAVSTLVTRRLVVQYDAQTCQLHFAKESCLKWLTYIALAVKPIEEMYGHTIRVSNY
jgi:hypothetical protein